MSNKWMLNRGDLTKMPNPIDEEVENEIHRLQLLAVPFVEKIMPRVRLLASKTKGMSPGEYIPLAVGILVEETGLVEKQGTDV